MGNNISGIGGVSGNSVYPLPVQPVYRVTPARSVGQDARKDLGDKVEISPNCMGMKGRIPVEYLPEYSWVVSVKNDDSVGEI